VLTRDAEYPTSAFGALSFRFVIHCSDLSLARYVGSLLSSLAVEPSTAGTDAHLYALTRLPGGGVDLSRNETRIAQLPDAMSAVGWLLWDLNQEAVRSTSDRLLFHAGGVQSGDFGVLLPAPSGSGKSTLVTALVQAGCGYLSDELVAFSLLTGQLLPYPKPVTLKPGSFPFFEALRPPGAPGSDGQEPGKWLVRPDDIRSGSVGHACNPRLVVTPRYVAGAPTRLRRLPPDEAFLALALNTVNLERLGARGARLLGNLVEVCASYELVMSDPEAATGLVFELLGQTS
jgi:hypothetical protein